MKIVPAKVDHKWVFKYIILVINVTAACVRGCAASVGLLVTGKENKRGSA